MQAWTSENDGAHPTTGEWYRGGYYASEGGSQCLQCGRAEDCNDDEYRPKCMGGATSDSCISCLNNDASNPKPGNPKTNTGVVWQPANDNNRRDKVCSWGCQKGFRVTAAKDGCEQCSKPLGAVFTGPDVVDEFTPNPCAWECALDGYKVVSNQCVACSISSCPNGQYRKVCEGRANYLNPRPNGDDCVACSTLVGGSRSVESNQGVLTPGNKQATGSTGGLGVSACRFECIPNDSVADPDTGAVVGQDHIQQKCHQCLGEALGTCLCSNDKYLKLTYQINGNNGFFAECNDCPAANTKSTDPAGVTTTSCHCDEFSYETSSESCTLCPGGGLAFPYPDQAFSLQNCYCQAGAYLSTVGSGSCQQCPSGKYCPNPDLKYQSSQRQYDCPSGSAMSTSLSGQSSVDNCAPDSAAGAYLFKKSPPWDSVIRTCPSGLPAKFVYAAHNDDPANYLSASEITSLPNRVEPSGPCRVACAQGYVQITDSAGNLDCDCENPKVSVTGYTGCFCPAGMYPNPDHSSPTVCVACPADKYCPQPSVKASGGMEAIDCPKNDAQTVSSFSPSGAASHLACYPNAGGWYTWSMDRTKLYPCPSAPVTTTFSALLPSPPPAAAFAHDSASQLTLATAVYDSLNVLPSASPRVCSLKCATGYQRHDGSQAGSFLCMCSGNLQIKSSSDATCVCRPRFYDLGGTCEPCTENYYCPGDGTRKQCPVNTFAGEGVAQAESDCGCPEGSYGTSSCLTCPAGKLCPGGSNFENCPEGFYCPNTGGSPTNPADKIACGAGKTSDAGTSSLAQCYSCPAGSYCPGNSAAVPCSDSESPSDQALVTSDAGATGASQCMCIAGYYGNPFALPNRCQICPKGTYCVKVSNR